MYLLVLDCFIIAQFIPHRKDTEYYSNNYNSANKKKQASFYAHVLLS